MFLHGPFCLSYTYGIHLADCRVDSDVGTPKADGGFPICSLSLKTAMSTTHNVWYRKLQLQGELNVRQT